jgi:glycosyltransferase involved in cell wall biosynthesis
MAAGKAIVAFEGGGGEVLRHLENGYLVPDRNEEAFAAGILRCLEDQSLSKRMGSAALETAGDFNLEAMIRRVRDVYASIQLRESLELGFP